MKNDHLLTGIRGLRYRKVTVVAYIIGLAITMVISMVIGLWIHNKVAITPKVKESTYELVKN